MHHSLVQNPWAKLGFPGEVAKKKRRHQRRNAAKMEKWTTAWYKIPELSSGFQVWSRKERKATRR